MNSKKYNIFNHKNNHSICNCKYQLTTFASQKFNRDFINKLIDNFSNKNGIGIYSYAVILANAITNTKYNKNKKMKEYPYAHFTNSDFSKRIGKLFNNGSLIWDKTERKSAVNDLGILESSELVRNFEYKDGFYSYCLNRKSDKTICKGSVISEFATVKGGEGYFFIEKGEVNKIVRNMNGLKFSECDAVIDLMMHTVFNDDNVELSQNCPLVCYDANGIDCTVTIRQLAHRWNMATGSVCKLLKKLNRLNIFHCFALPNKGIYITAPAYAKSIWDINEIHESVWDFYKDAYRANGIICYTKMMNKKVVEFLKNKKEKIKEILGNKCNLFFEKLKNILNTNKNLRSFLINKNYIGFSSNDVFLSYVRRLISIIFKNNYILV